MKLSKIISTALLCSSTLITSAVINTSKASATDACATDPSSISSLSDWTTCRGTPSVYGMTVYKMGLCTANPASGGSGATPDYSSCELTYNNTSGEYTSFAADQTNSLSGGTTTMPTAGTYGYAFIKFNKTYKLKGQYGPLGDGNTYYSNGSSPSRTSSNTSTNASDLAEFDAPLESFSMASTLVCQSISDAVNGSASTLTGYLLDSSGNIVVNSGANGNCTGVQDILGVATFNNGSEVTIPSSISSITATFSVTNNGSILYRAGDGGLGMDSGPFDVEFTIVE